MKEIFIKNKNYFITLVTEKREPFLLENVQLLQKCFKSAQQYYSFKMNGLVILPDHIHFMMTVNDVDEIPEIIRNLKRSFTTWYNESLAERGIASTQRFVGDRRPWKKGYDEYVITSPEDLKLHLDYMHYNPVKHGYVKSPKDWTYSSFSSYAAMGIYHSDWSLDKDLAAAGCTE